MKRGLAPDETRLWATVAATVRPFPGRTVDKPSAATRKPSPAATKAAAPAAQVIAAEPRPRPTRALAQPETIEPGRHRRLTRGRDPIAAVIDLHGLTQDRARAALTAFVARAHQEGERSVLVITGKGAIEGGVLRRRVPEWLAEPPLRQAVAGLSEAHRRHGGEGALYVALRRKERA